MIVDKARSYIGLCMAAGGIKTGVDTVLGEIRSHRTRLVLVSSDASDRTKKQLGDKCDYYKTPLIETKYTADEFSAMIGKHSPCTSMAFTGRGPWKNVFDLLSANETDVPSMTEDRKDDN